MDKQALTNGLEAMIAEDRPEPVKIFLRLLKQTWEIDWTVAAYDVMSHFLAFDIPYFYLFMQRDTGDEAAETELFQDWIEARVKLNADNKQTLIEVIDEVNQLRNKVRIAA